MHCGLVCSAAKCFVRRARVCVRLKNCQNLRSMYSVLYFFDFFLKSIFYFFLTLTDGGASNSGITQACGVDFE